MSSKSKIAIIGVGLLGGSLALALKKRGAARLVGWNHRASSRRKAAKLLPVVPTFEKAVEGADVLLLCGHSSSVGPSLWQALLYLKPNALVMDVSSVKGGVVKEAGHIKGMEKFFVPCHPMAGKEKSGATYASADLYKGKFIFITPLKGNPKSLVQRAAKFWKGIGAIPVIIDARLHDRSVALTSHLPHLLAAAYMNLYEKQEARHAGIRCAVGSGFRDFTRIAGSNPAMWTDIVEMNGTEIKNFLKGYIQVLQNLQWNLKKGNRRHWLSFFEKARTAREKLQ